MQGFEAIYDPISIIDFQGSINSSGQSQGHYVCDVQEQTSKLWFRTNDNCYPKQISSAQVSNKAYVILLKKSKN